MGKPLSISELRSREELKRRSRADRQRERDNVRSAREDERDEARAKREHKEDLCQQAAAASANLLATMVTLHKQPFSPEKSKEYFDLTIQELKTFIDHPDEFEAFEPEEFHKRSFHPAQQLKSGTEKMVVFFILCAVVTYWGTTSGFFHDFANTPSAREMFTLRSAFDLVGIGFFFAVLSLPTILITNAVTGIFRLIKSGIAKARGRKQFARSEREREIKLIESEKLRRQEWQAQKIIFDKDQVLELAKRKTERLESIKHMEAAKRGDLASIRCLVEDHFLSMTFDGTTMTAKCDVISPEELRLSIIAPDKSIVPTYTIELSPSGKTMKNVELNENKRGLIYCMFLHSLTLMDIIESYNAYPYWNRLRISVGVPTIDAGTGANVSAPFLEGEVTIEQVQGIVFEKVEPMHATEALELRRIDIPDKLRLCDAA